MVHQEIGKFVLTRGNLRNNYLRISQFDNLLCEEIKGNGGDIILDLYGIGKIKTHIDKKKGIFSERKAIGNFFKVNNLKSGDELSIEKINENHFRINTRHNKSNSENSNIMNKENINTETYISKTQMLLFEDEKSRSKTLKKRSIQNVKRANDLDGKEWTSFSISIWKNIRKTNAELRIDHPAMFPLNLVQRIIRCFTTTSEKMILDPFMGSGSTLIGACALGKIGLGFEIYPDYIELAKQRLKFYNQNKAESINFKIYPHDAIDINEYIEPNSIDLCFTSPPYWNILTQRRTADYKEIRNYGKSINDLGRINDYSDFIKALGKIFGKVLKTLKSGKYCIINVMDLRKKSYFYPFHADLAKELESKGYIFDDIIIWDRSHEYNNLRPLGYPSKFRINKVHEYLLIFQKPLIKESKKIGEEKTKS